MSWMIYGANGYTGRIIAELAASRGERPALAGRSGEHIEPLAAELGLDYQIVDLLDGAALREVLADVDLVVHCAGPFAETAAQMVAACLDSGTHYIDIAGEIDVLESIYARHDDAVSAGVVLLPGAGFDVMPTDCLAGILGAEVPKATHLDLAFLSGGGTSPGTRKTGIEVTSAGRARVNGELVSVPLAHKRLVVSFPSGARAVSSIAWGDVSSVFRSTGIPNITTYTTMPVGPPVLRGQPVISPLIRADPVQRAAKMLVTRLVRGSTEAERASGHNEVWGQARDEEGRISTKTLIVRDPYSFTAEAVLAATSRIMGGEVPAGAHTPAQAFGAHFVTTFDGVQLLDSP